MRPFKTVASLPFPRFLDPMSPTLPLLCCAATLAWPGLVSMATAQGTAKAKFPGEVVSAVVVPVPSEIFSVLDKLGEPNWQQEIGHGDLPKTGDRTRLALVFGCVVAEGFVAVQAQDKEAVKDIGRDVMDLATALGLIKSVRPHAQAILDAADQSDWPAIRREFDRTQKTVRDTMDEMRDGDLSQCVSLGGWLRGTASVTSIIGKHFSEDRAELLNQPMLVEHFLGAIDGMAKSTRKHPLLETIRGGLSGTLSEMNAAKGSFSREAVTKIGVTCKASLTAILGR